MRLSDAILLGSLVVKPETRVLLIKRHDVDYGCALGMAHKAAGLIQNWENQDSLASIYAHWPWTLKPLENLYGGQCGMLCRGINAANFIAHMFRLPHRPHRRGPGSASLDARAASRLGPRPRAARAGGAGMCAAGN
jgi:hypothetical protein